MKRVKAQPARHFIMFFTLLVCAACNVQPGNRSADDGVSADSAIESHTKSHGHLDGGGGTASKSTPAEVAEAIHQAVKLASEPDPRRNIFVQFWLQTNRDADDKVIKNPNHLFPLGPNLIFKPRSTLQVVDDLGKFKSPALQALGRNKLILKDTGDCAQPDDTKHAEASVSAFKLDADICFSVADLTRLPKTSLLREVLSLALHEAIHLAGVDNETEPQIWQDHFSEYFDARFGGVNNEQIADRSLQLLQGARDLLARADKMNMKKPNDQGVYYRIGEAVQKLASLPYFLDPLMLELSENPAHPEFINNYSNSVLATIEKGRTHFAENSPELSQSQTHDLIQEMDSGISIVMDNLDAFLGTSEDAKSKCVLPKMPFDQEFFQSYMPFPSLSVEMYAPPLKCD